MLIVKLFQASDSLDGRVSSNENRIPESIQRELDKRRIGDRYLLLSNEQHLIVYWHYFFE